MLIAYDQTRDFDINEFFISIAKALIR